jgi:hypothetical protein
MVILETTSKQSEIVSAVSAGDNAQLQTVVTPQTEIHWSVGVGMFVAHLYEPVHHFVDVRLKPLQRGHRIRVRNELAVL